LNIVCDRTVEPKQGAEGASVSSDARRLCDARGRRLARLSRHPTGCLFALVAEVGFELPQIEYYYFVHRENLCTFLFEMLDISTII